MSEQLRNIGNNIMKFIRYIKNNTIGGILLKYITGIAVLFIMAVIIGFHYPSGQTDNANNKQIVIEIKSGMQTAQIAALLKDKDVIDHDFYFRLLAKIKGLDKQLKVGSYILQKDMSDSAVMELLIKGPTLNTIKVTIPEGYTVEKIADVLSKDNIVDRNEFLRLAKSYTPYEYMKNNDPNVKYKVEGYLFPDTYEFLINSSPKQIMDIMLNEFNKKYDEELRKRAKDKNLSAHELVVLASLVEAEARYENDRPIIAQVFFNRLKINMPLQSDTTIQYAMKERKEELMIKDTKIDSPYNTYMHYGLPPGAVGNPGMASIKAVLYPQNNDYLYFVADSTGHNHYSRTYQEHLRIIDSIK
ncbi:endolytic transglycosylase MltG [Pectinatus brassicae]|nr:endolytic transglycosylase MltG [Pectinatus brassicae]